VVAGVDSASDADTSEAGKIPTEAADSTTSGACFVGKHFRWQSSQILPFIFLVIHPPEKGLCPSQCD